MNSTITNFGYPTNLVKEYANWVVMIRPMQLTLGSLVLACKEDAESFGDISTPSQEELSMAVNASIEAGVNGIQSGNGFGPPTTSIQIKKLSEIVKNRCSIKAVGGIKTFNQAREIVQAGATHIGTSFGFELIQGQKNNTQ